MGKKLVNVVDEIIREAKKDQTLVEFSDKELQKFNDSINEKMEAIRNQYIMKEAASQTEASTLLITF